MELFYDQYANILYFKISLVITEQEHADNILQKSFASIWGRYSTFDPDKKFLYEWILEITLTEVQTFYSRFDIILSDEEIAHFTEPTIFELVYFGNYTRAEIAEKYSITVEALNLQLRMELNVVRNANKAAPVFMIPGN